MATMRSRAGRTWIFVTVFLLLAMVGGAVWLFSGIRGAQPGDDLEKVMARARGAGFPMTRDEAYPPATGKPEDNGADDFLDGQDLLQAKFGSGTGGSTQLSNWRKGGLSEAERANLLNLAGPGLAKVRASLAKPYIRFEKDFDQSTFMGFSETVRYKPVVNLLLLSAERAADHAEADKALEELGLVVKLDHEFTKNPLILQALVQVATRSYFDATLRHVAAKFAGDPKSMERLAKLVATLPSSVDVHKVMAEEFYTTLALARNLNQMGGPKAVEALKRIDDKVSDLYPKGDKVVHVGLPTDDYSRGELRQAVETYLRIDSVLQDRTLDVTNRLDKLKRIFTDLNRSTASMDRLTQVSFSIGRQVFPVFEKLRGNAAVEEAYMKVMVFRANQGHFPSSLKEANALVADPFYDGPLNYFPQGDGFTLMTPGLDTEVTDPATGRTKTVSGKISIFYPPKAGD
jgi:hypothetical protein